MARRKLNPAHAWPVKITEGFTIYVRVNDLYHIPWKRNVTRIVRITNPAPDAQGRIAGQYWNLELQEPSSKVKKIAASLIIKKEGVYHGDR